MLPSIQERLGSFLTMLPIVLLIFFVDHLVAFVDIRAAEQPIYGEGLATDPVKIGSLLSCLERIPHIDYVDRCVASMTVQWRTEASLMEISSKSLTWPDLGFQFVPKKGRALRNENEALASAYWMNHTDTGLGQQIMILGRGFDLVGSVDVQAFWSFRASNGSSISEPSMYVVLSSEAMSFVVDQVLQQCPDDLAVHFYPVLTVASPRHIDTVLDKLHREFPEFAFRGSPRDPLVRVLAFKANLVLVVSIIVATVLTIIAAQHSPMRHLLEGAAFSVALYVPLCLLVDSASSSGSYPITVRLSWQVCWFGAILLVSICLISRTRQA